MLSQFIALSETLKYSAEVVDTAENDNHYGQQSASLHGEGLNFTYVPTDNDV